MRQYGHQCQKYFGLFNYFSLSSHQISLSPSATHLSLSLYLVLSSPISPRHATPLTTTPRHADLIKPCRFVWFGGFDLITPCRSHHATNHHHATPVCLTITSHHVDLCLVQRCTFVPVDVGLFDLVDVSLCWWWVWDVGLWMWWVAVDFFFFFFKVALVDVGLCRWWLLVLLRQWLLVVVVAAMMVVPLLLLMMIGRS